MNSPFDILGLLCGITPLFQAAVMARSIAFPTLAGVAWWRFAISG
jgi:hypothetical protein